MSETADKLASIVPMLGSDNPNEVLAAVAALKRVLASQGKNMNDLLALLQGVAAPHFEGQEKRHRTERRKREMREAAAHEALMKDFATRALHHAECCGLKPPEVEFLQIAAAAERLQGRLLFEYSQVKRFYWSERRLGCSPHPRSIGERFVKVWSRIRDHMERPRTGSFEWYMEKWIAQEAIRTMRL